MFKHLLLASFSLLILNSCMENNNLNSSIDSIFKEEYKNNEPGAAVLIMKDDSVVFSKGYGIADMSTMKKIDDNTFFNIASVSKQFSAIATLMLHEEGKLSIEDSIVKWFPDFKADIFQKIKIKHLLSHTSGIPDSRDRSNREFVLKAKDVESYSYIKDLKELNFEPGTGYEYMNPTFQLLYTLVEKASGMPFEQFMHEKIFSPSNMRQTLYFEEGRVIPSMAHGYIKEENGFKEYDYLEESFFATKADGGIYTSVNEFIEWEKALRNYTLISKDLTDIAHSPKITVTDLPNTSYGYGWFIEEKPGFPQKVFHTGDNGGFQIYAARYPKQKILYLIFANRNDKNREDLADKIDQVLKKEGWLN